MIKAIIIDDETLARSVIKNYLKNFPEIQIVQEAGNGFDGLKAILEHKPDLIFLDIQMPKLSGLEMLELVEDRPVVIFSTAFDQYALQAFEHHAIDYLLKPFDKKRFNDAMSRAIAAISQEKIPGDIDLLIEEQQSKVTSIDRIAVRQGSKIIIIPVNEIDHIQGEDDYVGIYSNGKKYLKQWKMKYLEEALPGDSFLRVHRSHILALKSIDRLEAYSKDSYLAILSNGEKIPVSRTGYQNLKSVLGF